MSNSQSCKIQVGVLYIHFFTVKNHIADVHPYRHNTHTQTQYTHRHTHRHTHTDTTHTVTVTHRDTTHRHTHQSLLFQHLTCGCVFVMSGSDWFPWCCW